MMSGKCNVCKAACVLLVIGGLNWGLIGLGGFLSKDLNVVAMLLGSWPMVEWLVYVLVGVSAVLAILGPKYCPCSKGMA